MTLAGVAMINSEVAPLSPVAGSGKATCSFTSFSNTYTNIYVLYGLD